MRSAIWAVLVGWIALPQAATAQATSPVYFLVDASQSMEPYTSEAKARLESEVQALPAGQETISVTYFGKGQGAGAKVDNCKQLVGLEPAQSRETALRDFPPLGGDKDTTAIGKALESVFSRGGSKVVLITDGQEECAYPFASIRKRFPDADIHVIQVGPKRNTALDLLELKPAKVEGESVGQDPIGADGPLEIKLPTPVTVKLAEGSDAWAEANPLNRYLWMFAYLCLATGVALLGFRFGAMEHGLRGAISALDRRMRANLSPDSTEEAEAEADAELPAEMTREQIAAPAQRYLDWTMWAALLAVVVGFPLTFSKDADQRVFCGIVSAMGLAIAIWLAFAMPVASASVNTASLGASQRTFVFGPRRDPWVFVGLLSVVALLMVFAVDLDEARAAAWSVLGTDFSGLLAIVASAPVLFFGARWWSYKEAQFTYLQVYSRALSDKLRQKREDEKRFKREWEDFSGRFLRWTIPVPIIEGVVERLRRPRAETSRSAVVSKAKEIVERETAKWKPSERLDLYRKALGPGTASAFILAMVDAGLVKDPEQQTLWRTLAGALEDGRPKEVSRAMSKLR